jgi:fumarate reductase flavoprotein subunit
VIVAGAGMAGLVAGAHAGATVLEKGDRPGGSMLLSSGFVWRYRDMETFREQCPDGDEALQRLVFERLDDDLDWLESLGAPVLERETANPLTSGRRFDVSALTDVLARRCGELRLNEPLLELPREAPVVLATGGFQGDRALVREHITPEAEHVRLRSNRWSSGDGLRLGLAAGGSLSSGVGEFYGRCMPAAPFGERDFVRLSQLYARHATVEDDAGEGYEPRHWSETDVAQWVARRPGAEAWLVVDDAALGERVRERTVGDMVEAARGAGARLERRGAATAVRVVAAITQTLGGLRVDASGRVADGVFAAGADAGGVSAGGWSSGLAAALVLGRVAAESATAAS